MERLIACSNCEYQQFTDGYRVCPRCGGTSWYDVQMNQLHQINNQMRDLQVQWYRDGGCCGCTKTKRRITLIILGLICIIVGIVLYFVMDADQKQYQSGGLAAIGALFILGGICCPNYCCYGNAQRGGYQRA